MGFKTSMFKGNILGFIYMLAGKKFEELWNTSVLYPTIIYDKCESVVVVLCLRD